MVCIHPTNPLLATLIFVAAAQAQPVINETGFHLGSDLNADDNFGHSISLDLTFALVGAPGNDEVELDAGAAYVMCVNSTNQFEFQKLLPPDPQPGAEFGHAVSIVGNLWDGGYAAVVTAPGLDVGQYIDAGAAYVYRFNGSNWYLQDVLHASNLETGARFGESVCIWTNYNGSQIALSPAIIVGAPYEDWPTIATDSGAAYIFEYDDDPQNPNWPLMQRLFAPLPTDDDHFGAAVALSHSRHLPFIASRALIGAPGDDEIAPEAGAAYILDYHPDGQSYAWLHTAKLTGSASGPGARFGAAVALDAGAGMTASHTDYALVGAPENLTTGTGTGSVYVFAPDPAGDQGVVPLSWPEVDQLIPLGAAIDDHIGEAVAFETDPWQTRSIAVIGAPGDDSIDIDAGAAYLYKSAWPGWTEDAKIINSLAQEGDCFGNTVAQAETMAAVGACFANPSPTLPDAGLMLWIGGLNDCTSNGILDVVDISLGVEQDTNGNGIPDSCQTPCSRADITTQGANECSADYFMPDGVHTAADLNLYVNLWLDAVFISDTYFADYTTQGAGIGDPLFGVPDGIVTTADLLFYLNIWIDPCS